MTLTIIITLCLLLLFAYLFDISSSKTKIPSVILLLALGFIVKELTEYSNLNIPDLTPVLPILGTLGLILIVLEGSLELTLDKSKTKLITASTLVSLISMLIISFGLAYAFMYYGNSSYRTGLINAIPFAVISSAIAIPSAKNLSAGKKEFITYESSLSDIFGVVFFNFIVLNESFGFQTYGSFLLKILITLVVTFISTLGLAYILSKIKHHVKFAPIILMITLIYAIAKYYHLPSLINILLFGLFLSNLDNFKHIKFIKSLQPEILSKEVRKFEELIAELTFLIRSLFFLLFGFLIETSNLLNTSTLIWAGSITAAVFILRFIILKTFRVSIRPLLYIAPRGLITILLILSIPDNMANNLVNNSLVIQVIILSSLVMMVGIITKKKTIYKDIEYREDKTLDN
jgi:Kef-type K+ transport system membrane component KefB